jgi:uncharacterized protein DUF397
MSTITVAPSHVDRTRLTWHKSSYSNGAGGMCVEVAPVPGAAAVRDSKNPEGPILVFSERRWGAFVAGAREGSFDIA